MMEKEVHVKYKSERIDEISLDTKLNEIALELQKALSSLPEECKEGVTGNISVRLDDHMLVTATGAPLGDLKVPQNFCKVSFDTTNNKIKYYGNELPSSESPLHLTIYKKREDVKYCLHIHLPNLDKLQLLNRYPMTQDEYAYGTWDLAHEASSALGSNDILILKNHGIVAVGADLDHVIHKVESLCNI